MNILYFETERVLAGLLPAGHARIELIGASDNEARRKCRVPRGIQPCDSVSLDVEPNRDPGVEESRRTQFEAVFELVSRHISV